MKLFFNQFLEVGLAEEILHHIQTVVDRLYILQREYQPTPHQAGSHRADGLVDNIQQTASSIVHRTHQLQAAYRKLVQADILILLNPRQRSDVGNLCVLRHDEVL